MTGTVTVGRFAPSPTGELHLGNLRTALVAWLAVLTGGPGSKYLVRFEDLDRVTSSREIAAGQLRDLAAIGIVPAEEPVFQSDRFGLYDRAIDDLIGRGLTYPCFCTRKEIQQAAQAPHGAVGRYPGTCRSLTPRERARKAMERPGATRLNAAATGLAGADIAFQDRLAGSVGGGFVGAGAVSAPVDGLIDGVVDDVVLRRNDGVPSYNVAVVVDDAAQGVTQVVRGDDLLPVTPTQVALQRLFGLPTPEYFHVPLKMGPDGERLAKRHGAVTLSDLARDGVGAEQVRSQLLGEIAAFAPWLVRT